MATYNRFEELPVWKDARLLYREIVDITRRDKLKQEYRCCSQIKAAAGSVMDNVAEGFERDSKLEFINHLSYAKGSVGEVRSQLYRALDENFVEVNEHRFLNDRYLTLAANIATFIRYLNTSDVKGLKFAGRDRDQK